MRTVEAARNPEHVTLGRFGAAVESLGYNNIADYSTVLVYAKQPASVRVPRIDDRGTMDEVVVVVLEPDPLLHRYGRTTTQGQSWENWGSRALWRCVKSSGWQAL